MTLIDTPKARRVDKKQTSASLEPVKEIISGGEMVGYSRGLGSVFSCFRANECAFALMRVCSFISAKVRQNTT